MAVRSVVNVIDTSIQRHPARPVVEEVPVGVSAQQLGAGQSTSGSSGEIGLRRLLGGEWRGSRAKAMAMAISSQYSRQQRKERRKVGICVESKSGCESSESMVAAHAKGSEGSWDNVSRPGD